MGKEMGEVSICMVLGMRIELTWNHFRRFLRPVRIPVPPAQRALMILNYLIEIINKLRAHCHFFYIFAIYRLPLIELLSAMF